MPKCKTLEIRSREESLRRPTLCYKTADHMLIEWSIEFAHPDVAKADGWAGVAVGLEFDGGAIESFVEGRADVTGLAFQLEVILDQHSIEKNGDVGGRFQGAVGVENGSGPGDVIGLPF